MTEQPLGLNLQREADQLEVELRREAAPYMAQLPDEDYQQELGRIRRQAMVQVTWQHQQDDMDVVDAAMNPPEQEGHGPMDAVPDQRGVAQDGTGWSDQERVRPRRQHTSDSGHRETHQAT